MICIVDYGVGNLKSIQNMLSRAHAQSIIGNSPEEVRKATKLVLPGMGHFDYCMQQFNHSGLRDIVEEKVMQQKVPVLGICVGLQMLMRSSEEGKEQGLNWIPGQTVRFFHNEAHAALKIPNMGWLEVRGTRHSSFLDDLENPRFYFAHSYHVQTDQVMDALMTAEYGYRFTAAVARENIFGVQFHPEKSHRFGMQLMSNFAHKV